MINDPFNPAFGKSPLLFLDRQTILNDYLDELSEADDQLNTPYQTTMISGVRGIGKTAFLSEIEERIEQLNDWIVVDIRNNPQMIDQVIGLLKSRPEIQISTINAKLKRIKTKHFDIEIDTENAEKTVIFDEIFKQLAKKHIKVLIGIDEAASTSAMRELAMIYQQLVRKKYGVAMVMTGLPEDLAELQHNKVLTFLLRSNKLELSFLHSRSIERAFIENFLKGKRKISVEIAHCMTMLTKGYTYAFQLLGHLIWRATKPGDVIDQQVIDKVMEQYEYKLQTNVYQMIFDKLSKNDQAFLNAMSQSAQSSVKISTIVDQLQKSSGYWSVYRRRLIDFQLIRQDAYGYVSFCLPKFKEFLQYEQVLNESEW